MITEDYSKAYKMGRKDYQMRQAKGLRPTLKVLDEILPDRGQYSEVSLGLVQIPMDKIDGTKTESRSNAFAANFMPILAENTEFAEKWARLSESHVNEGIHDPIKAYEYMNRFYVEEGNKRVSVLKYYDAVSVPGMVTRILPQRTEEKENKLYFEFVDFYEVSRINYIWFSELGSFAKLQKAVGKEPKEEWTDEEKVDFKSVYYRFSAEFEARGGKEIPITTGDAFLRFIMLYGYRELCQKTVQQIKNLVVKSWEEFEVQGKPEGIHFKLSPNEEKKPLLNRLLPLSTPKQKIAFIYEKTPETSAWTYAHELGRLHLEQTFPDEVSTVYYDEVTKDTVKAVIQDAVHMGCDIIFTTTPAFVPESVKAAIAYKHVRILNCSLNISHRYIRTYYSRMYEAKFLMGAIAGAMTENDRVGYVADYPIFGAIANINAFALGAKMVNPRVQVQLEWSALKDSSWMDNLRQNNVSIISGKDMVVPKEGKRFFGLYRMEDDRPQSLAMPLWHWGKFYEQLIRAIMDGTWKYDDDVQEMKAINYWWGMSSRVIDVVCSQNLPIGTKRLVEMLKYMIGSGEFNPFAGVLYSQGGIIQNKADESLRPKEIIKMDWLAENVVGSIPKAEELQSEVMPTLVQQGLERDT